MVETAEDVGAGRGVGLGYVLPEDLGVDAGCFLHVVAERERLLSPVGASGACLAVLTGSGSRSG